MLLVINYDKINATSNLVFKATVKCNKLVGWTKKTNQHGNDFNLRRYRLGRVSNDHYLLI